LCAGARRWEANGQEPVFGGQTYTFSPGPQDGAYWVEAEVQWPDGRRAFATNSVIASTNAAPQLGSPQGLSGGTFSFTLPASGVLLITDPQAGSLSRRYYRALKAS
jgi:hypothetical protein